MRALILPRVLWGHRRVLRGLYRNGCITGSQFGGGSHFAHAHVAGAGKGWICVAPGTKETDLLLLHELAHLISGPTTGAHTRRWKAAFRRLGEEHSEAMAQLVEHEIWDDYSDVRRTG